MDDDIQNTRHIEFHIHGMDCVEEITVLKRELLPILGSEERLAFDLLNQKLTVDVSTQDVTQNELLVAIERAGLKARLWDDELKGKETKPFFEERQRAIVTTLSGICGLTGLVIQLAYQSTYSIPLLSITFYCLGIIAGLYMVIPKVWRALVSFRPDMNLLMSIAVIGAVLIGEWFEGATVAFLFSFSLLLESWSVGRARRSIAKLMDLSPPIAHLKDDAGVVVDVAPNEVSTGSILVVKPGERIPLDGRLAVGTGAVNQAPITGESVPVEKEPGDEVFAGSINGDGLLEIETTKEAHDTTLARIAKMVGEAAAKRAHSEMWVESFAAVYTPIIMFVALAILVIPPLIFEGEWSVWLYRSLVLLVIACPCALVISTPVSIVAALAAAARSGVLVKGGVVMELPSKISAIAMDKTGTITKGEPQVIDVIAMGEIEELELLMRAGALESNSNHPLARAIVKEAKRRVPALPKAESFESIQGRGAVGTVDGETLWIGSPKFLKQRGQGTPELFRAIDTAHEAGRTVVIVGDDERIYGLLTLADSVRSDARETIHQLRELGVRKIVMLTGDNHSAAMAAAGDAGIDDVHSDLLPEDKVAAIEELVRQHSVVAMIGDGVNDAPALALASMGIAMGAAGSDTAIETADIALMSDDLSRIPWLIRHSRRTTGIIRQNIAFSLMVKAAFVALTFVGFTSLWAAIAADMGASLIVIANGLRLLKS